ncbi:MAG: sensor domain-containing diguanylate cyclase [Hyphomicrobiales bacterium]|nr:MAG: sensor domain-containing diguanylate cyclase [Hyphomicrobiales bacterium]
MRLELEALMQFLYLAPVGLVQTRHDGEILLLNPRCAQWLLPLAPGGDLQNLFAALSPLAPDLRQRVDAFKDPYGKICEGVHLPVRAGRAPGSFGQVLSLTLIRLDADRLMAVLDDVTEQLRRERALRQSQAWLHSFVEGPQDYACISLDGQGCIEAWNGNIERVVGHRADKVIGTHFSALFLNEASAAASDHALVEADAGGWVIEEAWLKRGDGRRIWSSALLAARHQPGETDPASRGYSLVVRNMSGQQETIEELRRAISCDHLTGLANRRAFFEAAHAEMQRCARQGLPLSLLMVDADHFKHVNDQYGHAVGDAVLQHLATSLSHGIRGVDVLARIGGEEFVVLMPGTRLVDAELAADRLCEHVRRHPAECGTLHVGCTISIGVAAMIQNDNLEDLMRRADVALYAAKAAGRDRVRTWQPESVGQCA